MIHNRLQDMVGSLALENYISWNFFNYNTKFDKSGGLIHYLD